jgi:putative flippase GtrA
MPTSQSRTPLIRQFSSFVVIGFGVAFVHYAVLIGLVEGAGVRPVPATLFGYIVGGILSYGLNFRFTYRATRSHGAAIPRFALVAGIGFLITWGIMHGLVERLAIPYLAAQVFTHGIVLMWSFLAHKSFSFRDRP